MEKDISPRSTKNEILKAYNELTAQYEAGATGVADKKAEAKARVDKAVVDKVSGYTAESIVRGLADFKLKIGKTLTDLAEQLTEEADRLPEMKQAIAVETKYLEEIHGIKAAADTLANLIRAQEERKNKFESEMIEHRESFKKEVSEQKAAWLKEQKEHELAVKERDTKLKKDREREKEDYEYNLALTRKKDNDDYEARRTALEKSLEEKKTSQEKGLSEREEIVSSREKEFAELKTEVEKFSIEFSEGVKKAEKAASTAAENKAKVEAQLLAKEVEGEEKLAKLKISSLEDTINKQNIQVQGLTKQLNAANAQVQDIAVQVIGGVADSKALNKVNEIALEQAKGMGAKA